MRRACRVSASSRCAWAWEDLNDAQALRFDSIHQVAAGRDEPLAGASTPCQFENARSRRTAVPINRIWVDTFIASHDRPPAVITLDFDATDAPAHGRREGHFSHGYHDHHCFPPRYVFCGDHLPVACPRRSNADGARPGVSRSVDLVYYSAHKSRMKQFLLGLLVLLLIGVLLAASSARRVYLRKKANRGMPKHNLTWR